MAPDNRSADAMDAVSPLAHHTTFDDSGRKGSPAAASLFASPRSGCSSAHGGEEGPPPVLVRMPTCASTPVQRAPLGPYAGSSFRGLGSHQQHPNPWSPPTPLTRPCSPPTERPRALIRTHGRAERAQGAGRHRRLRGAQPVLRTPPSSSPPGRVPGPHFPLRQLLARVLRLRLHIPGAPHAGASALPTRASARGSLLGATPTAVTARTGEPTPLCLHLLLTHLLPVPQPTAE